MGQLSNAIGERVGKTSGQGQQQGLEELYHHHQQQQQQ